MQDFFFIKDKEISEHEVKTIYFKNLHPNYPYICQSGE